MSGHEMESPDPSFDSMEDISDVRIARRRTIFLEEGNTTMIQGMNKRIASFAAFKKRRLSTILLMQQEGHRIKSAQAKESRMERELSISPLHYHVIEVVAMHMNLEPDQVLEGVLDSWLHVSFLNSLFLADGRLALLFYFVELEPLSLLDSGRIIPHTTVKSKIKCLIVTDGLSIKADGLCVVVYRLKAEVAIDVRNCNEGGFAGLANASNMVQHTFLNKVGNTVNCMTTWHHISKELFFTSFEVDANDMNRNVIAAINTMMSTYLTPVINVTNVGWGALQTEYNGESIKKEFRQDLEVFNAFLEGTKIDLLGGIEFETYDDLWEGVLSTPDEVMVSANYSKVVNRVEACVRKWSRQLTEVFIYILYLSNK